MQTDTQFEIFLTAPPGLEHLLAEEAREKGFALPRALPGGVAVTGGWPEVWRANLELRGCGQVLARIGEFRAFHLAQLDKRSRKFDWAAVLRSDQPVRVEATCRRSKIYHDRAAAQRVAKAINETLGVPISAEAEITVKLRIEDDLVTISVDTSGEPLHRRGHKQAVGKAPMRETLAALFLRRAGYDGAMPVLDPMCGSGTFVIEAAEIAAGLRPGRSRGFAFEKLASFDPVLWQRMLGGHAPVAPSARFHGSDRDEGAIAGSRANAERAGVAGWCDFRRATISEITPPAGQPGLVMVNPPYGTRIGDRKQLFGLYATLGRVLLERFAGWRVGLVTSDSQLAHATALPFEPTDPPVAFGGLKVKLYRTGPLGDQGPRTGTPAAEPDQSLERAASTDSGPPPDDARNRKAKQ